VSLSKLSEIMLTCLHPLFRGGTKGGVPGSAARKGEGELKGVVRVAQRKAVGESYGLDGFTLSS